MNYDQLAASFREEQLQLEEQLSLRPEVIDSTFFQRNWQPVRGVNFIHRLGASLGIVYGTISFVFAYVQWGDYHASIPLLVGGLGMFANGWFLPAQTLPTKDLEKYSVASLIEKLVAFRRYAMQRIWIDCLVTLIFLFGLVVGVLNYYYGINFFLELSTVPIRFGFIGGLIAFALVAAVGGNAKQMRQLKEIEHQLAGYREDDLV